MRMKNLFGIVGVGCAAALASATPLHAQTTGATVLDYQLASGQGASGVSIAADAASGGVLSAGNAYDASGILQGIALTTADPPLASWTLNDNTLLDNPPATASPYKDSEVYDCGYDSGGNLYSVGQLSQLENGVGADEYWYVRKSSDGGKTWATADLYQFTAGANASAAGFAADGSGNVYVAGQGLEVVSVSKRQSQSYLHWLVRRYDASKGGWENVDDQLADNLGGVTPTAVAVLPNVGVFAVGGYGTWVVRRSLSGDPGSFKNVDGPTANATAEGVGTDSAGNIYVTGYQFVQTGTTTYHGKTQVTGYNQWLTRMSSDGGTHWGTVDTYNLASDKSSLASGVTIGPDAGVVVVGGAYDGSSWHWIVRQRDLNTGAWSTLEDYRPAVGWAVASKAATDASGHLLVVGSAYYDDGGGNHWIVRLY
jgi:hypothetical protein